MILGVGGNIFKKRRETLEEQESKSGLGILGRESAVGIGKILKILTIMLVRRSC